MDARNYREDRGRRDGPVRGRPQGKPEGSWKLKLGFRRLTELKDQSPQMILLHLSGKNSRLSDALNDDSLDGDMIGLFLRCIAKSLECQSMQTNTIDVLTTTESSKWKEKLLESLLFLPHNLGGLQNARQVLLDTMLFFKVLAEKMPSKITSLLGIYSVLDATVNAMKDRRSIMDEELWEKFQECIEIKDSVMHKRDKQQQKQQKKKSNVETEDEEEPPDDFRDIPVYPVTADLRENSEMKPFLRRNKRQGKYRDVDNYLDVQFRLLREDFICPLREGIKEFKEAMTAEGKAKRIQDLRIYDNVYIISPKSTNSGLSYRVGFDTERLQRVRWEVSKRLIYGSLVALSSDRFESVIFATVAERDPKKLKDGIIDLRFETSISDVDISALPRDTSFIMAETTAYFESYKHVLAGLQQLHEGDLAFERYIVNCETIVRRPAYLRQNEEANFDLRPLIDEHVKLRGEKRNERLTGLLGGEPTYNFTHQSRGADKVDIRSPREWPTANQLHLDASQYRAVQTALTNEFVITQGPPGTGKTYIGLKIAKALLHNYSIWNRNPNDGTTSHRPMLVVCYTNHALDQFLEGIIDFYKGDVIRVGGRSNSEKMKDKSVASYRIKLRADKAMPSQIYRARREARDLLTHYSEEINRVSAEIEAVEREVVHEDVLQRFMGEFYTDLVMGLENFLFESGVNIPTKRLRKHSAIVEWLGYGNLINVVHGDTDIQMQEGENIGLGHDEAGNMQVQNEERRAENAELVDIEDEVDRITAMRELDDVFDNILNEGDISTEEELINLIKDIHIGPRTIALNVSELDENEEENGWRMTSKQKKKLKQSLRRELRSSDRMSLEEIDTIVDVWDLTLKDKWRLYRHWTRQYSDSLKERIKDKEKALERASNQHQEILMQEDKEIMRRATVIGMTTTGAAKYQAILTEIGPRVVIVEEAAEVLEGHVITALSRECQHLILIGDHKQLKPNPTVYKLAKDFNLDLSLFERMINNGLYHDCLQLQHRMRPQISGMMRLIYPELKDHDEVKEYPNVRGVTSNMFFIDHSNPEETDEDQKSHSNVYEAQYLVALCRYLLLQGYEASQITILTLYTGQLFELRRLMPKQEFQGVRVTVVDNFQGEENDIILLSLVRSNEDGKIGFLAVENRVCVALSRAKHGLFVIGNMSMIERKSPLWKKAIHYARKENILGDGILLQCQNHPNDEGIFAETPEDFRKAPMGGCMKPCEFRLPCGHTCALVCHITDEDHSEYQCRKPCAKIICKEGHRCQRFCYQKCEGCLVPVEKNMPKCGHKEYMPCYLDPFQHCCTQNCLKNLPCGHRCTNKCGEKHTEICTEKVLRAWSCGHRALVACHERTSALCKEKCETTLKCGHPCRGTCGECSMGRLHIPCTSKCDRPLVCDHSCPDFCSLCPPCKKRCENRCRHSKCQKPCGAPCVPCMEPCEWRCRHHQCTKRCGEPCNRPRCNRPCREFLRCGHPCIGLCGEPCPEYCRICHQDTVQEIFFGNEDEPDARFVFLEDCGHIIEYQALDHWIDHANKDKETAAIQLRTCPKCKAAIRKNMRYGDVVKQALLDIERVKRKNLGDEINIAKLCRSIPSDIRGKFRPGTSERRELERFFDIAREREVVTENELIAVDTRIRFLDKISEIRRDWGSYPDLRALEEIGLDGFDTLNNWLLKNRKTFSGQEVEDAQDELQRIVSIRSFLGYKQKIHDIDFKPSSKLVDMMQGVEQFLTDGKKFTEERAEETSKVLKALKEEVPRSGLGVSEEVRVQIVQAIGLAQGHWYKCPKGHIYAIGECGGANQGGRCPECGAAIGGQSYRLADGNAVATEMDGARYSAWSEQANLNNRPQ